MFGRLALATLLGSLALSTRAQNISQHCESGGVCYQLHIPENTASTGHGDIFFQISGPTSNQWIGLGQGQSMSDSSLFVIYADGKGNVTLSSRQGVGQVMPNAWTTPDVELLAGSGVVDGQMIANVRCGNCNSWGSGSMDFTGSSGSWLFAKKSGSALNTANVDTNIVQHDADANFVWDFTAAKGGSSANPFISNNSTVTPNTLGSSSDANDGAYLNPLILAHGTMAAVAFIALFPTGGIFVRLASFPGMIWVHAAIQLLSYAVYTAAFGLGVYIARQEDYLSNHHAIIGMIIFAILFFSPFTGLLHHRIFKKNGGKRSIWTQEHIWFGRLAIILGMINGGLGLQLAGDNTAGNVAGYTVGAIIMGVAFIGSISYGEIKRRRQRLQQFDASPNEEKQQHNDSEAALMP